VDDLVGVLDSDANLLPVCESVDDRVAVLDRVRVPDRVLLAVCEGVDDRVGVLDRVRVPDRVLLGV